MRDKIENAIRLMQCLEFFCEGFARIVEPHCLGVSGKGNYVLRAYQIGGHSSSGRLGWRLYDIEKIESLIILDEYFEDTRPDYSRGDKNMKRIVIEL